MHLECLEVAIKQNQWLPIISPSMFSNKLACLDKPSGNLKKKKKEVICMLCCHTFSVERAQLTKRRSAGTASCNVSVHTAQCLETSTHGCEIQMQSPHRHLGMLQENVSEVK